MEFFRDGNCGDNSIIETNGSNVVDELSVPQRGRA
jgi:hypothetical protein